MDRISDIADALDEALRGSVLESFQQRRRELTGGHAWSGILLSQQKDCKAPRSGYAFHKGGRSELQFNIGFEEGGAWFRFGVAFGIQPGQSLPDPEVVLRPKIERFNAVLRGPHDYADLQMWHYADDELQAPRPAGTIPDAWVRSGVFIFIGRRLRLGAVGVTPRIIREAADVLVRLWALYEQIENGELLDVHQPERLVARLCWNTNDWKGPTGRDGKALATDTFEAVHGYGHEEWLFDWRHIHDGWQYGFIQGVVASRQGECFDVLLYTLHTKKSARYWVGVINDVEVLTMEEASRATARLERSGELARMRREVTELGLKPWTLHHNDDNHVLNVRFRRTDAVLFDEYVPFGKDELPMGRYKLQQPKPAQLALYRPGPARDDALGRRLHTAVSQRRTYADVKDIDPVHAKWQERLKVTVPEDLPGARAIAEKQMGLHRVDMVIDHENLCVFVELKTADTASRVIREGLAQLIDYAFRPDQTRCHALILSGHAPATSADHAYLHTLRKRFSIPVYYLQIDDGRLVGMAGLWPTLVSAHGKTRVSNSR